MDKERTWHIELIKEYEIDTLYDEYYTGTEADANIRQKELCDQAENNKIPGLENVGKVYAYITEIK